MPADPESKLASRPSSNPPVPKRPSSYAASKLAAVSAIAVGVAKVRVVAPNPEIIWACPIVAGPESVTFPIFSLVIAVWTRVLAEARFAAVSTKPNVASNVDDALFCRTKFICSTEAFVVNPMLSALSRSDGDALNKAPAVSLRVKVSLEMGTIAV